MCFQGRIESETWAGVTKGAEILEEYFRKVDNSIDRFINNRDILEHEATDVRQETAQKIDIAIKTIIDDQYTRAKQILEDKIEALHDIEVKDGLAFVSDAPGLGVDFDELAAEPYPYKRSYLPVSRLEDGTVWNW